MAFLFGPKKEKVTEDEDLGLPPLPPEDDFDNMPLETEKAVMRPTMMQSSPMMAPMQMDRSRPQIKSGAKIFVRIDKYKDIIQTIESMNEKITNLQETLNKIGAIKAKEAEIISGWGALLTDAKAKADDVNEKLLRPVE